jgi:hypothetical protein
MTDDSILVDQQQQKDIKRILIERDIITLKQAFCRIMCAESHNNNKKELRSFAPYQLFSRDRLQTYLSRNKEMGFGRKLLESEDFNVYKTIIDLVIRELVSDGTIVKQQQKETTPDNPEEKYEAAEKLDRICNDFRDSGLSFY